jgi:hypothetical protein
MAKETPFMKNPQIDTVTVPPKFMRAVDYIQAAAALYIDVDRKWKANSDSDIDIMCHLHCFMMAHTGHSRADATSSGHHAVINRYHAVELEPWKLASIYRQIATLEDMVASEIKEQGEDGLAEDLLLLGMDLRTLIDSFKIVHAEYKKLAR